jgi:RNA polymerase sigma-54 factor
MSQVAKLQKIQKMIYQSNVQRQQLRILPQQIQLLNLFHLNTLELNQRIKEELEENPCLEELNEESSETVEGENISPDKIEDDCREWEDDLLDDIADAKIIYSNYLNSEIYSEKPFIQSDSFQQILKDQYKFILSSEADLQMADYIVDSMDETGFLTEDIDVVAENFSFKYNHWVSSKEIENMLHFIQGLEPPGIGARNVCECLILQLKRLPDNFQVQKAIDLLENYYTDLKNRNMFKIREALQLDEIQLKDILKLIGSLNMHPVITVQDQSFSNGYIIPDFILTVDGDEMNVSLYRSSAAALTINYGWLDSVNSKNCNKQLDKATQQYIKSKITSAKWFISAIQQRESSMLKIMKAIVNWQRDYFLEGDISFLKPMILKDIAQVVQMDISSVSRITSNKYVSTPFGLILLKNLFNEGISTVEGNIVSSHVIKNALEEIIVSEDKKSPFTDQQLVKKLAQRGYMIARRTVAKYRELLHIRTAQMRALWQ